MAKSRSGRGGGPIPIPPRLAGAGRTSIADLLRGAKPVAAPHQSFPVVPPGFSSSPPSKAAPVAPERLAEARQQAFEGGRLVQQGRVNEGIALLRRSTKLNPRVAELHHDLGVALIAAKRLEQAAEAFGLALGLNPRIPTTHHYLAEIFMSQGDDEKALASFRTAVALKPDLIGSQFRLGQLCMRRGQRAEAAVAFRAAAAARGTLFGGLGGARALEAVGAVDDALAAIRAVVETYPKSGMAHAVMGNLLAQSGLSAEAADHYQLAAELDPDMSAAWGGVATNRKFTTRDGPLIARMNAALARPHVTLRERQSLHLALGKAHDDLGEYEAAMRNFEEGARIRALGPRLDRNAHARNIDRVMAATPPGFRDRQADPGVEDATPILIVGMPRSGTTLVERILSSHPEVAAAGELTFWTERVTGSGDVRAPASTPASMRRLADDYVKLLRTFGPDAKRVTDKMPGNFMRLGLIHRVFPNATIVHCRRRPIDTAFSIFTTDFVTNLDYAGTRRDLVFYIRQYQRLMDHWRSALPPDRLVEVDYEALVADPEPQARRLIAASGLAWDDACLAPHRNPRKVDTASAWQVRQPIYRTSVERWRRYEPWLGELRELAPPEA